MAATRPRATTSSAAITWVRIGPSLRSMHSGRRSRWTAGMSRRTTRWGCSTRPRRNSPRRVPSSMPPSFPLRERLTCTTISATSSICRVMRPRQSCISKRRRRSIPRIREPGTTSDWRKRKSVRRPAHGTRSPVRRMSPGRRRRPLPIIERSRHSRPQRVSGRRTGWRCQRTAVSSGPRRRSGRVFR